MRISLIGVGAVYLLVTLLLIVYGANLTYFSYVVTRRGRKQVGSLADGAATQEPFDLAAIETNELPRVTVQLPIYNELYVTERIIDAACALDYPRDRVQIQVLDDSTDETADIVARVVARYRSAGVDIEHIHRTHREGYKAGALAAGLESATGQLVAIFDADFVPEPDFLLRTVPSFIDEKLAFVQGRWGHLNDDYSMLTRIQSVAIDGHFLVEQSCRGEKDYWFNFNGTAGIWRIAAIKDAGGWTAETLTEDLDLSYRAHLNGWHGQFLEDVVIPGEVPAQMSGFRRQQHRWARGSLECAIKLVPEIWRSDARRPVKFQATVHLTSYSIHLLLFVLTIIYPFVVVVGREFVRFQTFYGFAYFFALFSIAPVIFFVTAQRKLGQSWWRTLPRILSITMIGPGLMLNTIRAAYGIWKHPNPEFERTPKFGLDDEGTMETNWTRKRYQLDVDRIVFFEIALGLYSLGSATFAFVNGNWAVLVFSAMFGVGLITVATLTLTQSVRLWRDKSAREAAREREVIALAAPATVAQPTRAPVAGA